MPIGRTDSYAAGTAPTATDQPNNPTPAVRLRVEYHDGDEVSVLGMLPDAAPRHTTLDPFFSQLLLSEADGELLLIDVTTGAVVASCRVRPFTPIRVIAADDACIRTGGLGLGFRRLVVLPERRRHAIQ